MAKNPVQLTEKEARDLGGNNLIVPETATAKEVKGDWADGAQEYIWTEMMTIDDVRWDGEPTKPGSQEPSEYSDLDHEKFVVRLRVSQFHPSDNQGRVVFDHSDFIWGLRHMDQAELKMLRDTLTNGDIRRTYYGRSFGLQGSCRKMATLFQATGFEDRLTGRGKNRFFNGFSSVLDILPAIVGKTVAVKIRQRPMKDGGVRDEVVAFSPAE